METDIFEENHPPLYSKSSLKGLFIAGLTGGTALAISILSFPFISPALRRICLPFVPATNKQIKNVFRALEGRRGTLLDIGSGDGRIVVAAAKRGYKASGVELNLWLVLYSRWTALRNGVANSATFYRRDLWNFDFRPYENVIIFGVKEMMKDLNTKFEKDLRNSYVVACRFPLPDKEPIKTVGTGIDRVWLYHFIDNRSCKTSNKW